MDSKGVEKVLNGLLFDNIPYQVYTAFRHLLNLELITEDEFEDAVNRFDGSDKAANLAYCLEVFSEINKYLQRVEEAKNLEDKSPEGSIIDRLKLAKMQNKQFKAMSDSVDRYVSTHAPYLTKPPVPAFKVPMPNCAFSDILDGEDNYEL